MARVTRQPTRDAAGGEDGNPLQLTVAGDGARLVINRPQAGNLFTTELLGRFVELVGEVRAANSAVLVIEGRGDDFCLGRDASGDTHPEAATRSFELVVEASARLRELPSVVVVAVHGRARGMGAGLVFQSDIALASSCATLAFDELERGFPPTIVLSYLEEHLPRKVARELVLTGRELSAQQARQLGVVNQVVDLPRLRAATERVVERLLSMDPDALRFCKPYLLGLDDVQPPQRGRHAVHELVGFLGRASAGET